MEEQLTDQPDDYKRDEAPLEWEKNIDGEKKKDLCHVG